MTRSKSAPAAAHRDESSGPMQDRMPVATSTLTRTLVLCPAATEGHDHVRRPALIILTVAARSFRERSAPEVADRDNRHSDEETAAEQPASRAFTICTRSAWPWRLVCRLRDLRCEIRVASISSDNYEGTRAIDRAFGGVSKGNPFLQEACGCRNTGQAIVWVVVTATSAILLQTSAEG